MTIEVSSQLDAVQRRLERENISVVRLLNKIKSYRLEPKDYSCFQLMQQIKRELFELMTSQENTLDKIVVRTTPLEMIFEDAESLSLRFKNVEQKIAEYLLRMRQ